MHAHERSTQLLRDQWAADVRDGVIQDTAATRALLGRDIADGAGQGHSVAFGSDSVSRVDVCQDAAGQLFIFGPDVEEFSAESARAIAANLIAAADKVDEIESAS